MTVEAWQVVGVGEPREVFELRQVELPDPPPGQIRLTVAAAAVGFPDVAMCRGVYALTPKHPFTPGQELVGTVTAVGDGAMVAVGDRVMAVSSFQYGHGSFARECLAGAHFAMPAPADMSDHEAGGFLIPFHTGWVGLVRRAQLQPGETLLVLGAAGGTGSAAVQLGKALGATVIATAGGAQKAAHCTSLGADHVIDYRTDDIASTVRELTNGRGVEVVYDTVGGDAFHAATRCIAHEGRLLAVGFAGGEWGRPSIPHMVQRNYSVLGVMPGNGYDVEFKQRSHDALLSLWREGRLHPPVHRVFPFGEVPRAVEEVAAGRPMGKVIVQIAD